MILIGMLSTRIQLNGRMLLKVIIVAVVLTLFLSACSADWWVGDGRGDWTLDIHKGYAISKINSNEILLVFKKNPNDSGGSIVLPNYFVVAYQLQEPYICLEGIRTQRMSASEEELNNMALSYYIVDTNSDDIIGPFEFYEDFVKHCDSLKLEMKDEWIKTRGDTGTVLLSPENEPHYYH